MGASDAFARNIYIRLADDGVGFHYAIKYGGIPVRQGFVPTFREDGSPAPGPSFVPRSDEDNAQPDSEDTE
ncbi:MAG TPA: hypothetical protein VMT32_03165 [Bryobacteraceae bacterium]|nr:hypothetical protein [Bryobacteraceae bacterium]